MMAKNNRQPIKYDRVRRRWHRLMDMSDILRMSWLCPDRRYSRAKLVKGRVHFRIA